MGRVVAVEAVIGVARSPLALRKSLQLLTCTDLLGELYFNACYTAGRSKLLDGFPSSGTPVSVLMNRLSPGW